MTDKPQAQWDWSPREPQFIRCTRCGLVLKAGVIDPEDCPGCEARYYKAAFEALSCVPSDSGAPLTREDMDKALFKPFRKP